MAKAVTKTKKERQKKRSPPVKTGYHHGDLRTALIEASVALILENGVEALSLREVALRVGVSSAAPYHHFSSKAALLGAIAGMGFLGLGQAMEAALRELADPEDAHARLAAIGSAYVDFARAHPTEFRLMFRPSMVTPGDLPEDCRPDVAFELLLDAVTRVTRTLPPSLIEPRALVVTAWSLVHGAAELLLEGPLGAKDSGLAVQPSEVGPMVVSTLTTLLRAASVSRATGGRR